MAKVHLLTVGAGDCTIIEHNSGHVTMIDICGGNRVMTKIEARIIETLESPRGNFAMCKKPTNPIEYLKSLGIKSLFRFILTHPDMDHLDGFNNLANEISIDNFWDSGARKDKPNFEGSLYEEKDWDRYVKFRDGDEAGVTVVTPCAGSMFKYANKKDDGSTGGDALYIAAPSRQMIADANELQEFNDASYIISYWSNGGRLVFPGDAHNGSWEYTIKNHKDDVENCSFLLAPHHGRKSNRDFTYLNTAKPGVSLLGCAPSKDLAYHAWKNRNLSYYTQNQAGNTVLEIEKDKIDIYIENDTFAANAGGDISIKNGQGYYYLGTIS
jgi:competence protein ComEC